ncbi:MAG: FAD-dependent oxidoreductase, partial [Gammaproteobacteria bacterium]|nr:FAD-dependent oxidoreductase [Gammaproteobacteria bacterium]
MHVLVLGAGVVGVTTAYYLAQHGCAVTVIDRAHGVAEEASFGNAGQLSYSFTDALARPSFLTKLPGLVFGRQPGSRVHLEPQLIPWGLSFITQCTSWHARENTLAVLRSAMRSAKLLDELCTNAKFDFSHRAAGKLVLLSDKAELRMAEANSELKKRHGCETKIVSRDEAIAIEPAIADMHSDILAAVYSRSDEVADSRSFTDGLRGWLEQSGRVRFRLDSNVEGLVLENGNAVGVTVDGDALRADAV